MQELDRVRRGRLPQELDEERATALHVEEIACIARSLAETASAAAAAAAAPTLSAANLAARLAEIDATCDACHRLYRDPPKALAP